MSRIEIRLAVDEDHEGWNNVARQSQNGTFYHTWEWTETIKNGITGNGEETIRICASNGEEIIGIYPVFLRKAYVDTKFKQFLPLKVAWSPHPKFYGFGGPCVLGNNQNKTLDELLKFATKFKVLHNWIWAHNEENLLESLKENNYNLRRHKKTTIIDLGPTEEAIFSSIKKKYRQNIRFAEKSGMKIIETNTLEDILEYFDRFQSELLRDIKKQPGVGYIQISNATVPRSYFEELYKHVFRDNMARLFFAEHEGKRIGALINFYYKDTVYLGHTAIFKDEGKLHPYKLLIWHTIKDAKGKEFKKLDLTGLPPDETHGQYRFKKDWNGKIVEIGIYKRTVK